MNAPLDQVSTKKQYSAPLVVVHGDVTSLTLDVVGGAGKNDNGGSGNQKSTGV